MSTGLPNRDLIPRYFAPYLAYVGVASLASALPREWDYALRIAATVMALAWGWRHFAPLRGPNALGASVAIGITPGLIGLALWVALLAPFGESNREAWNPAAIALRVVAACCLVPVFEELAMRGFVHRFVIQWQRNRAAGHSGAFARTLDRDSVDSVEAGAWSVAAVAVSALLFAAAHQSSEWPAAIGYGVLMSTLWILRKDLLSCVVAHGVTNLALAGYVIQTGRWELW